MSLEALVTSAPGYCLASRPPASQGGPPLQPHVYTLKQRIQLGTHPDTRRVDAGNTILAAEWDMAFQIDGNTYYLIALDQIYGHGTPALAGEIERISVGDEGEFVGLPAGVMQLREVPGAVPVARPEAERPDVRVAQAHQARAQGKGPPAVPAKPAPKQAPGASRKDDPRNTEST